MGTVLIGRDYASRFNTPRRPLVHNVVRGLSPWTLRRAWRPLENIGYWNPFGSFDLVHTFNKIPLWSKRPWMVTFESVLPRTLGHRQEVVRDLLRSRLLSDSCRGIVAISEYAIRRTAAALEGWERLPELLARIQVVPPNVPLRRPRCAYSGGKMEVVFIGNEFARKGGIVTLRMAKMALALRLPIHFHIVSSLRYGKGIYTDYQDSAAYGPDLALLQLKNVTQYGNLPNLTVMELLGRSHFLLLPTVHDTYGYSPLEAMSLGVPVIASATAAIPEFMKDGENGFLLPMQNDAAGDWVHLREPPLRWDDLDRLYDELAHAALEKLVRVVDCPDLWGQLSRGALMHIARHHDAATVGAQLEQMYSAALEPDYAAGKRNSRNGATRCAQAASSWVPPSTRI